VIAIAVAHGLADGAPAASGAGVVAALSGLCAAAALAWAVGSRSLRWVVTSAVAWWAGWTGGVALAGAFGLSGGSTPAEWQAEHAVIAGILGLSWGGATSPAVRRLVERLQSPWRA
jgi:hypothetical protein